MELRFMQELASGNGSWLSLFIALAVLPYVYLKFAFNTQKEYTDLAKTIFNTNKSINKSDKEKLIMKIEQAIQVFQVEWGLICAVAILTAANFGAVFVIDASAFPKTGCSHSEELGDTRQIMCRSVKAALIIYGISTVLLIAFRLAWARAVAMRRLRQIYLEIPVARTRELRRKTPTSTWVMLRR